MKLAATILFSIATTYSVLAAHHTMKLEVRLMRTGFIMLHGVPLAGRSGSPMQCSVRNQTIHTVSERSGTREELSFAYKLT